jgi:hypothetical protein
MNLLLNWYRLASFGPGRSGTILQQVEFGASGQVSAGEAGADGGMSFRTPVEASI